MSAEGGPDVQDELATTVAALCHLQGEFMLRSGQTTSVHFDKYLFEAEPAVLGLVARRISLTSLRQQYAVIHQRQATTGDRAPAPRAGRRLRRPM